MPLHLSLSLSLDAEAKLGSGEVEMVRGSTPNPSRNDCAHDSPERRHMRMPLMPILMIIRIDYRRPQGLHADRKVQLTVRMLPIRIPTVCILPACSTVQFGTF